ncbi:UTP--glucose-1-phosphate uridylyltransferase [Amylibacter sp.]|nr:UTP--glucose-1-phosphate uridylyltransferase [Amylibacter sp.]
MTYETQIKKAIIPVAGLGTRMLPATKAIPKELLTIYDRPIIQYVVEEAIAGGITEIILITRNGKEAIENHFDAHYELEHRLENKGKRKILGTVRNIIPDHVKVISIRQSDALGLGHAVLCAKDLIGDEPFAVLLPDVLVLDKGNKTPHYSFVQLIKAWNKTKVGQIMVERVDFQKLENFGIADLADSDIAPFKSVPLKGLVEKPSPNNAPSNLAILGRYILPSKLFKLLESTEVGVGGEIQLTDALDKLVNFDGLNVFETDADIYDCGNKKGFLSANIAIGMRDPEALKIIDKIFKQKQH